MASQMKTIAAAFTLVALGGSICCSDALAQDGPRPFTPAYGFSGEGIIRTPTANDGGRVLRRNTTPTVSPWINLLPEEAGTLEQQYFNRYLPQDSLIRTQDQTRRALRSVHREIRQQQVQIQSGLSPTTGRRTSFMNQGPYFGRR